MLEKMSTFFENRLDGYDEHMMKFVSVEVMGSWGPTYCLKAVK